MALQSITALASITLQSASASISFSGIPQNYRDLVLVFNGEITASATLGAYRFNGDETSSYTGIYTANALSGTRSTTSADFFYQGAAGRSVATIQVMDYSATNKHKTILARSGQTQEWVFMYANRWANTAAITSMTLLPVSASSPFTPLSTWMAGTTINLYGRIA